MLPQACPSLPSRLHPFVHVNSFVEMGTPTLTQLSLPHLSALSLKVYGFLTLSVLCHFFAVLWSQSLPFVQDCRSDRHRRLEEQCRLSTTDSDTRLASLGQRKRVLKTHPQGTKPGSDNSGEATWEQSVGICSVIVCFQDFLSRIQLQLLPCSCSCSLHLPALGDTATSPGPCPFYRDILVWHPWRL